MSESDNEMIVRIAREIINGTIPILVGCQLICGPIHRLGIDREEPFLTLIGVESETDHLPIDPEERKLWDLQALVEKEKEIADVTEWARNRVLAACLAVIRRSGEGI